MSKQGRTGRSAMSPLGRQMQQMARVNEFAEKTGMPLDEAADKLNDLKQEARNQSGPRISRRDFLKLSGMAALSLAFSTRARFASTLSGNPDVAVVGGGLAGLRAAHYLMGSTLDVRVYEGNDRLGGRCYTNRGFFADNMHAEMGGQLINIDQEGIQKLCKSLRIPLEDLSLDSKKEVTYFINGRHVAASNLQTQWVKNNYYKKFQAALKAAPWAPYYYKHKREHARLDNLSVNQWLNEVGIGANSDFGQVMQSTHLAEYGLNGDEGSALNLIYILAWNGKSLEPIEGSEVAYQIEGGNDRLVHAMADEIGASRIAMGKELIAISGEASGPYTLSFADGSEITAPKVILTIPHTTLRDVDIDSRIWNQFSQAKQDLVQNLGMATSNKFIIQFNKKFYLDQFTSPNGIKIKPTGDLYTNIGNGLVNCAWDETMGQRQLNPSNKGMMVCFPGRARAEAMHSTGLNVAAHNDDVNEFTAQIEQGIPGAIANLTGGSDPNQRKALAANWKMNKWTKGAYSAQLVGQWTRTTGAGEEVVGGNLHFAGEWTDVENGGFLEGAVNSGERAAQEVAQDT